jgi:outer membrane lipoprotein-sorting protein
MYRKCYPVLSMVFLLLWSNESFAQYEGYKPITNLGVFRNQFAEESSKVLSITSDFKQEKVLTALTETITSQGKFWFKRSNKVRIEYIKPYSYLMIMNGDKMTVRDGQKQSQVNVKSSKLFQQINRIMIDCVQGTILESKDFTSKVFENDRKFLLEMTPVSKSLKEFFQTIVLTVDKSDFSVSYIEMNEPGGDKTTITFIDKILNGNVSDGLFTP